MQNTINKIYKFIKKLVNLLEKELTMLQNQNSESTISSQNKITNILQKLVNLVFKLQKVKNETKNSNKQTLSKFDHDILNEFIKKINKEHSQKNGK